MLTDWRRDQFKREWKTYTPEMKKAIRRLIRPSQGAITTKSVPAATVGALKRKHIVMEMRFGKKKKLYLTERGCYLMDWLRETKQVTKDQ